MNLLEVLIASSVVGGFLIVSIVIELELLREVNTSIITKPQYSEYVCSMYQLLFELKAKAPDSHVFVSR